MSARPKRKQAGPKRWVVVIRDFVNGWSYLRRNGEWTPYEQNARPFTRQAMAKQIARLCQHNGYAATVEVVTPRIDAGETGN